MDPSSSPQLNEQVLVARVLTIAARQISAKLLSFSGWLITGFGAALALLLANISVIASYIPPPKLALAIFLYLGGLVLHIVQRALAALIAGGAAAGKAGERLGMEAAERKETVRFPLIFAEIESAVYWPMRSLVAKTYKKVLAGDLIVGARGLYKMAQWQVFLTFGQALMSIAAAVVIALGLKV